MLVESVSKIGTEFLDEIQRSLGETILREPFLGDKIKVDGYYKPTKTIIEFYGDYWHCNPSQWEPERQHPLLKETANEVWQRDANRVKGLEARGYQVVIVWESEFRSDPKETVERAIGVIRGRRLLDAV